MWLSTSLRLCSANTWSFAVMLGTCCPALVLVILLCGRAPSPDAFDQELQHCEIYDNDGAGSTRGCLLQWCSNEAKWQLSEQCNMTEGFLPYDPSYNAAYLSVTFPDDKTSARLSWLAFGLLLGSLCVEVALSLLTFIDPSLKKKRMSLSRRYQALMATVAAGLWFLRVASTSMLFVAAYQVSRPWGMYNVPGLLWTAASIIIGLTIGVQLFHCGLSTFQHRYTKRLSGQSGSKDLGPNASLSDSALSLRKSSLSRIADSPSAAILQKQLSGSAHRTAQAGIALETSLINFTWAELSKMYNADSPPVASGGFGKVYRGILNHEGRRKQIAIKILYGNVTAEDLASYKAELEVISRVHHRNLVRLLGYCTDGVSALVLEFVENGSLSDLLKGNQGHLLDWEKRLMIAVGAARGLSYLHHDACPRIIHRDVKASNILVDATFNAKVADFGLARILEQDKNHATTKVMGTIGYLAPDYAFSGNLTDKSDVYSFGVVLLELLTGRKPVDLERRDGEQSLVEWAWQTDSSGQDPIDFVDPRLEASIYKDEVLAVWKIALLCVNARARSRPGMDEVLGRLLGVNEQRISLPTCQIGLSGTKSDLADISVNGAPLPSGDVEQRAKEHESRENSLEVVFSNLMARAGKALETGSSHLSLNSEESVGMLEASTDEELPSQ